MFAPPKQDTIAGENHSSPSQPKPSSAKGTTVLRRSSRHTPRTVPPSKYGDPAATTTSGTLHPTNTNTVKKKRVTTPRVSAASSGVHKKPSTPHTTTNPNTTTTGKSVHKAPVKKKKKVTPRVSGTLSRDRPEQGEAEPPHDPRLHKMDEPEEEMEVEVEGEEGDEPQVEPPAYDGSSTAAHTSTSSSPPPTDRVETRRPSVATPAKDTNNNNNNNNNNNLNHVNHAEYAESAVSSNTRYIKYESEEEIGNDFHSSLENTNKNNNNHNNNSSINSNSNSNPLEPGNLVAQEKIEGQHVERVVRSRPEQIQEDNSKNEQQQEEVKEVIPRETILPREESEKNVYDEPEPRQPQREKENEEDDEEEEEENLDVLNDTTEVVVSVRVRPLILDKPPLLAANNNNNNTRDHLVYDVTHCKSSCLRVYDSSGLIECIKPPNRKSDLPVGALGDHTNNNNSSSNAANQRAIVNATKPFLFDSLFDAATSNEDIFAAFGKKVVNQVLKGYNGTIVCYGQSGSGKTHTMLGPEGGDLAFIKISKRKDYNPTTMTNTSYNNGEENLYGAWEIGEEVGLIPRMLCYLLEQVKMKENKINNNNNDTNHSGKSKKKIRYTLTLSVVEIYSENLRDLLQHFPKKESKRQARGSAAARKNNRNNNNAASINGGRSSSVQSSTPAESLNQNINDMDEDEDELDDVDFGLEDSDEDVNNFVKNYNNKRPATPIVTVPPLSKSGLHSTSSLGTGNRREKSSSRPGTTRTKKITPRAGSTSPGSYSMSANNNNNNAYPNLDNGNESTLRITNYTKKNLKANSKYNVAGNKNVPDHASNSVVINNVSVHVDGLTEVEVTDFAQAKRLVNEALIQRHVGATNLNISSSRSHTLFLLQVLQSTETRVYKGEEGDEEEMEDERNYETTVEYKKSLMSMVDLAGSERVSHTGAEGLRLKEAQTINLSLSQLSNVIRALTNNARKQAAAAAAGSAVQFNLEHVPYRDSKLTRLLQDSFGGNAITFLLCNVAPEKKNALETLSTLRFAQLAKQVKNKAIQNAVKHKKDVSNRSNNQTILENKEQKTKIKGLQREVETLKEQLRNAQEYALWLEKQLDYFMRRWMGSSSASTTPPATSLSVRKDGEGDPLLLSEDDANNSNNNNNNGSSQTRQHFLQQNARLTDSSLKEALTPTTATANYNNNNGTFTPILNADAAAAGSRATSGESPTEVEMEDEVLEEYLGVARALRQEREKHKQTQLELQAAQEQIVELYAKMEKKEEKLRITETARRSIWDTLVSTGEDGNGAHPSGNGEDETDEKNTHPEYNSSSSEDEDEEEGETNNNNNNTNDQEEEEEEASCRSSTVNSSVPWWRRKMGSTPGGSAIHNSNNNNNNRSTDMDFNQQNSDNNNNKQQLRGEEDGEGAEDGGRLSRLLGGLRVAAALAKGEDNYA